MAGRHRLGSRLRRAWSRGRRSVLFGPVDFVYSDDYRLSLGSVPLDPQRGERIVGALLASGITSRRRVLLPPPASLQELRRIHTDDWLERLRSPAALVKVVGFEPDPDQLELALDAQRSAVGGTLLATRRAIRYRRTAANLGGGFHHARPEQGMGFCIFNDVAVAIADARASGFAKPVLIVDLDLHDGNGTRAAFAEDPSVHTYSIHNQRWDDDSAVASTSIELSGAVDDRTYLEAIEESLTPLVERFRPGLVFFVAGTDPAADDPLGNWRISDDGLVRRDQLVLGSIRGRLGRVPIVITLAGGYGNHAWRHSARSLGWLATGEIVEPPSTEAITLIAYRRGFETLARHELLSDSPVPAEDLFALSDEDVRGGHGIADAQPRFLGHFSRHGIELLLERSGLLDQLRRRGFTHPAVRFELDNPAGETLRVYADLSRHALLIEVRVRQDRRAIRGHELLSIEWMLLQNPRQGFSGRNAMPGQSYPGLGMLSDIMSILVLLCERSGLEGILFVPSQYHLAAKGKRYLRFADPLDEAWFRAIQGAVAELPRLEATNAVAEGRLRDRDTGESIAWRPMPMVLPLSERLRVLVRGEHYEQGVRSALERLRFEVTRS